MPGGQLTAVRALHGKQIFVLHGNAVSRGGLQDLLAFSGGAGGQAVHADLHPVVHLQPLPGQQGGHAKLCDGRKDCLAAFQRHLCVRVSGQLLPQLGGDLVAQRVRDHHKHAGIFCQPFPHIMAVKVPLTGNVRNIAKFGQVTARRGSPAVGQAGQVPVGVQPLDKIGSVFQAVLQIGVALLQCLAESQVKMAVSGIHGIAVAGIKFPDLFGGAHVEAGGMLLPEIQQLGRGGQALAVGGVAVLPGAGPAGLYSAVQQLRLRRALPHGGKQPPVQHIVQHGQKVGGQQLFGVQFVKAGGQAQLLFHRAADAVQHTVIRAGQPVLHKAVAVGLAGLGDKRFQALQRGVPHGLGQCADQQMGGKPCRRRVLLLLVAGVFVHQLPKCGQAAELLDVGQRRVVGPKPGGQHGDQYIAGVFGRAAGQHPQNIHMQRQGSGVGAAQALQLLHPVAAVKKAGVQADSLAQGGGGLDAQLVHQHRSLVGAVFLAGQLQVQQPVILRGGQRKRVVDQVAAAGVIVSQQLFGGKIVLAGQPQKLDAGRRQAFRHIGKLGVRVLPEHDAPAGKVLQRRFKALLQGKADGFGGHLFLLF